MSIVFDMSTYQTETSMHETASVKDSREDLELHTQLQLVEESCNKQTPTTTYVHIKDIHQFLNRM